MIVCQTDLLRNSLRLKKMKLFFNQSVYWMSLLILQMNTCRVIDLWNGEFTCHIGMFICLLVHTDLAKEFHSGHGVTFQTLLSIVGQEV